LRVGKFHYFNLRRVSGCRLIHLRAILLNSDFIIPFSWWNFFMP
jgi:hypothetical protein